MENGLSDEEKFLESKIQFLQENLKDETITFELKKMPYDKEFQFILSFPSIDEQNEEKIKFLLTLNFTSKKIYLYSLTLSQTSDGRDFLPFITNTNFNKYNFESLNLFNIIENLKKFLSSLSDKNSDLTKIGRFYLGEQYDINLISNLKDIFTKRCFHYDSINGNYNNIPSLITISDDYLCLYEFGLESNKHLKDIKNKFVLVFYGNIKSILSFKKSLFCPIVTITFRRDSNNHIFNLKISGDEEEDMDSIMDILIEKIKKIGYRMNIYEKKRGQLPPINIANTEKNISLYEEKMQREANANIFKKLLSFYEEAIEYYSAINDKRYIGYNNKVKKLLKNEKYSELLG